MLLRALPSTDPVSVEARLGATRFTPSSQPSTGPASVEARLAAARTQRGEHCLERAYVDGGTILLSSFVDRCAASPASVRRDCKWVGRRRQPCARPCSRQSCLHRHSVEGRELGARPL